MYPGVGRIDRNHSRRPGPRVLRGVMAMLLNRLWAVVARLQGRYRVFIHKCSRDAEQEIFERKTEKQESAGSVRAERRRYKTESDEEGYSRERLLTVMLKSKKFVAGLRLR